MRIIGHLAAPLSALSGPWRQQDTAGPSAASFASVFCGKKLHKALCQYVGYIKISHTHAHAEREWSERSSKRCVIANKTEEKNKKMRIKQMRKLRRRINWLRVNWWITQHDCQTQAQMKTSPWWATPAIGPHTHRLGPPGIIKQFECIGRHLSGLKMIQLKISACEIIILNCTCRIPHSTTAISSHSLAARMQMIYARLMQIYRWFVLCLQRVEWHRKPKR